MNKNKTVNLDFDVRMVEWNLKHEVISKDQLNQYLKTLGDEASNAMPLSLDEEAAAQSSTHTNGSGN